MTIARQEEFDRDEILPSWFVNRLQDRVAPLASFRLDLMNATTVRATAAAGDSAAVLNVDGNWRFNEAAVTRAHPGGAAGTYLVFVTAKEQDIRIVPDPGSDFTDYAFALAIVSNGSTPTIVPGTVDVYRRVGSLLWNGTAITGLVQETAGAVSRPQIEVALTRPVFTALPAPLFDGQEILYQTAGMLAAGVGPWLLRYDSTIAGASKWKVLAADPWIATYATDTVLNGTVNVWNALPLSIALPVAGDYLVQFGGVIGNNLAAVGTRLTPSATGHAAAIADNAYHGSQSIDSVFAQCVLAGVSGTLALNYQSTVATGFGSTFTLSARPMRLG